MHFYATRVGHLTPGVLSYHGTWASSLQLSMQQSQPVSVRRNVIRVMLVFTTVSDTTTPGRMAALYGRAGSRRILAKTAMGASCDATRMLTCPCDRAWPSSRSVTQAFILSNNLVSRPGRVSQAALTEARSLHPKALAHHRGHFQRCSPSSP